jgi:D-threo-aldose 1-dehydrogenase
MQEIRLAATDIDTTRLGFGCAGLMRLPSRRGRQRLLREAFELGIRHFDVARSYGFGAAEAELGSFARGNRQRLVLATKFGIDVSTSGSRFGAAQGLARRLVRWFPAIRRLARGRTAGLYQPRRYDAEKARSSLEQSLRELRTDYLDLFLLHEPTVDDLRRTDVLEFLEDAKRKGLIRAYGVSGVASEILPICDELPALTPVVQIADDAIDRGIEAFGERTAQPAVTFGVLSEALPRIVRHVRSDRAARRRWEEATGHDCTKPERLAVLLLRYALRANPGGVVLLFSSRAAHLRSAAAEIEAAPMAHDPALDGLLERIDEEIRKPSP